MITVNKVDLQRMNLLKAAQLIIQPFDPQALKNRLRLAASAHGLK